MTILKKSTIAFVVALVLTLGAFFGFKHEPQAQVAFGETQGGTVSPTGAVLSNPSGFTFLETSQALEADSQFMLGGATGSTGIDQVPSIGSCASATSTAFDIVNPFNATATAQVVSVVTASQATSTTFYIGTTTLASGLASTNISPSLANAALVATGTQSYMASGATSDLGSGQISSGVNTVSKIVVGPTENVAMYATSTYGNAGALNYTPTSCSYKIRWEI